jgi:3-oxoacyl-[acyl-carrier protein] reductase
LQLRENPGRRPAARLDGMTVAISAPHPLASKLLAGLAELACTGMVLESPGPSTREGAIAALSATAEQLGRLDAIIHAPPLAAPANASFAQIGEEHWIAGAEQPIWTALVLFQAAHSIFGDTGGSIVSVLPTAALTGAAGFVPFAAAAEGIRQIVKSAARAWGHQGVRVNCLAAPLEEWNVSAEHPVPNRYGASLAGPNSPSDLAGAAALLISPLAGGVTGATVGLDRGTVLAP